MVVGDNRLLWGMHVRASERRVALVVVGVEVISNIKVRTKGIYRFCGGCVPGRENRTRLQCGREGKDTVGLLRVPF